MAPGTDEMFYNNQLIVYPNPSMGNIIASFSNTNIVEIKLVDLIGKEIFNTENVNQKEFVMDINTSPGIYFLRAKSSDGLYHSKKISFR